MIKNKSNIPVIILTAMGEDVNKIHGLKTGSDDYVTKPFEPEELYLRIKKLLRLYENINQSELRIEFGDYIFNTKTQDLKKNNQNLKLHMIGKLQSNKAKDAVKIFDYIHSLDGHS